MSIEKTKDKIKNEVDDYFKERADTTMSRGEMVEGISKILQKYIEVPKISADVEVSSGGKYPVVKYAIRISE